MQINKISNYNCNKKDSKPSFGMALDKVIYDGMVREEARAIKATKAAVNAATEGFSVELSRGIFLKHKTSGRKVIFKWTPERGEKYKKMAERDQNILLSTGFLAKATKADKSFIEKIISNLKGLPVIRKMFKSKDYAIATSPHTKFASQEELEAGVLDATKKAVEKYKNSTK